MSTRGGERWSRFDRTERLLYLVAFLLALALRLPALTDPPLSLSEARLARGAHEVARGAPYAGVHDPSSSSLASAAVSALFWIGDRADDLTARLPNALVGSLLALTAWLLRPVLGRPASLALAFLMASDAWQITFSRRLDGALWSAALAWLLLAVLARRFVDGATAGCDRPPVIAVLFLLLAATGPLAWSVLPPLLALAWLAPGPTTARWRSTPAVAAGIAVLAGIFLLTGLLAPISTSFTLWLTRSAAADGLGLALGGLLLRDQLAVIALAAAALFSQLLTSASAGEGLPGARIPAGLTPLLVAWLVWGAVQVAWLGGSRASWLVVQVPLLLLAAAWVGGLAERWPSGAAAAPLPRSAAARALATATAVLLVVGAARALPAGAPPPSALDSRTLPGFRLWAHDLTNAHAAALAEPAPLIVLAPELRGDPVIGWYLRRLPLAGRAIPLAGTATSWRIAPRAAGGEGDGAEGTRVPLREAVDGRQWIGLEVAPELGREPRS